MGDRRPNPNQRVAALIGAGGRLPISPMTLLGEHDTRSLYVERFWLPVLGPTAVWALRTLARRIRAGVADVDLEDLAAELGLPITTGGWSPVVRAVSRLDGYGLAHIGDDALAVAVVVHTVPERFRRRWPPALTAEHAAATRGVA